MKYFAHINSNNIVDQVIGNTTMEESAEWLETALDGSIRKNYAGLGFTYDAQRDGFIPPMPNDGQQYELNEETLNWVLI